MLTAGATFQYVLGRAERLVARNTSPNVRENPEPAVESSQHSGRVWDMYWELSSVHAKEISFPSVLNSNQNEHNLPLPLSEGGEGQRD